MEAIKVTDSHTGGEPTRVVTGGFPDLGRGSIAEKLKRFKAEFDHLRSGIINEPRGFPAIVGALLCEPDLPESDAGVIFFNNAAYLGMCGHGTIGVVETLRFLGKTTSGIVRLDTVTGTVEAKVNEDRSVSVRNVKSYRYKKDVEIEHPELGRVRGDIAWGGNWFFLVKEHGQVLSLSNIDSLSRFSSVVMETLEQKGYTGENGGRIDHVELFGESETGNSKNFVLCPGGEYDRSPCGTGTSAKLACLAADGVLKEGEIWIQESITGSTFAGSYDKTSNGIIPTITGSAHITSESTLYFNEKDPFRYGINS